MKNQVKIIAFTLLICTFFNVFGAFAFSEGVTETQKNDILSEENNSPFFDIVCSYNKTDSAIKIDFRMKNENVKKYEGTTLSLYKLFGAESIEDIKSGNVSAIRTDIPVANKTGCELRQTTLEQRLSKYVLSATDKNGNTVFSNTFYPALKGKELERSFKGVDFGSINDSVETLPDTVVIDIGLSGLESANGGYIYPTEYKTYTFGRELLGEIDKQMKIYSGIDANVYLRFESSGIFDGGYDSVMAIYAYTSFLSERYSAGKYNGIDGIILGDAQSVCKSTALASYADSVYAVAAAVNDGGFNTSVIVPVADEFSITEKAVESLCTSFSRTDEIIFTVMVETSLNPFGINKSYTDSYDALLDPEGFYSGGEDFSDEDLLDYEERVEAGFPPLTSNGAAGEYISSESLTRFLAFLRRMKNSNGCVNDNLIFNWETSEETVKNTALASYVYHFYKLMFTDRVRCFIVTLSDSYDAESRELLLGAIKNVDSDKSDKAFDKNRIAKYFGEDDFEALIFGFSAEKTVKRRIYNYPSYKNKPVNIRGSSNYFDFSSMASHGGWYQGNGCTSISSVKKDSQRHMSAKMKSEKGENAFIVHNYEYSESFAYTDYIAIDFLISSDTLGISFDVNVVLGGDGFTCEYKLYGMFPNSRYTIYLDTASLNEDMMADFIRIGASHTSGNESEYQLELYSIDALSKIYDDTDLEKLILEERERLKNYADSSESKDIDYTAIVFIVFIVLLTFLVMFMISRRQRKNKNKSEIT